MMGNHVPILFMEVSLVGTNSLNGILPRSDHGLFLILSHVEAELSHIPRHLFNQHLSSICLTKSIRVLCDWFELKWELVGRRTHARIFVIFNKICMDLCMYICMYIWIHVCIKYVYDVSNGTGGIEHCTCSITIYNHVYAVHYTPYWQTTSCHHTMSTHLRFN